MSRLLLVAPPFSGHLNPLMAMGRHLRERGHEPIFVTAPARVPLLRDLGFDVAPVLTSDPTALERIADTPRRVGSNPIRMGQQLKANIDLMPVVLAELRTLTDRLQPDLVLADFTAPVAGLVAAERSLPWITSMPTPFALETRSGTPAYCGGWLPPTHAGARARDALGRGLTRTVKRTFGIIFREHLDRLGTSIYRPDGTEASYSPTAILGLGPPELEFPRSWPAALSLIGPITAAPEPDPHLPGILDSVRPRILVTLGTHLTWAKTDLLARVRRLSGEIPTHDFVVTWGHPPAPGAPPSTTTTVDGRIHVVDYLPYDAALPAFEAVIHHGGAGIAYSTLRAGLPALVWPRDYDQPDFAARLVHAGVALRTRDLGSPRSIGQLQTVLSGLDASARHRLRMAVRDSDPLDATARAVDAHLTGAGRRGGLS